MINYVRNSSAIEKECSLQSSFKVHGRLPSIRGLTVQLNVQDGKTALHNAVEFGRKQTVEILLNKQAAVDATDKVQHTF